MKLKFKPFLISLSIVMSCSASAGALEKIFDKLSVQTNSASFVSSQRSNSISLGGMSVRNELITNKVISFRPPSASASCGGIDIFAGSFSMISKDELNQVGRAIAQGAATYAFGIALASICPMCSAEMKNIQEKLDQYNKAIKNSCENIGAWMDKESATWSENTQAFAKKHGPSGKTISGYMPDWGGTLANSDEDPHGSAKDAGLGDVLEVDFNIAYRGIIDLKLDERLALSTGMGEADAAQFLMNMTGVLIQRVEDTGDSTKAQQSKDTEVPRVNLSDYLYGVKDKKILKCNSDTNDQCLSPTEVDPSSDLEEGMIALIEKQLYDDSGTPSGLIVKAQTRTLSVAEASVFGQSNYAALRLAEAVPHDAGSRKKLAHLLAKDIAVNQAEAFVSSMDRGFSELDKKTYSQGAKQLVSDFRKMLLKVREDMTDHMKVARSEVRNDAVNFKSLLEMIHASSIVREKVRNGNKLGDLG